MIVSCGGNWWEVIATTSQKALFYKNGGKDFPPILYAKYATYKMPLELILVEFLVEFLFKSIQPSLSDAIISQYPPPGRSMPHNFSFFS